ncbi:MAG: cell division protein ZapB [Treponema sp.]|nr:cell division protein ZapB [Treponema sp.]
MINLEQVKLLETKVAKAIEYVERLTKENAALHRQETELQTRLESYQKRIDELEILVIDFKEDQGRIEESILSALDRLSQFEKAMEKTLHKPAGKSVKETGDDGQEAPEAEGAASDNPGEGQTCFEIPEAAMAADDPANDGELDIF